MNNFELEDFIVKNFQEVKPFQETQFEVQDKLLNPESTEEIKGGKELENKDLNKNSKIETFEAKVTRPILSKFEYVGCITSLANYLKNLKSISKYTEAVDCCILVNPSELAFRLLDQGKMDVVIIRNRSERVTFSKLHQNPLWREEVNNFFISKNKSMETEFYNPISELTKDKE